jgi:hypothetical protein
VRDFGRGVKYGLLTCAYRKDEIAFAKKKRNEKHQNRSLHCLHSVTVRWAVFVGTKPLGVCVCLTTLGEIQVGRAFRATLDALDFLRAVYKPEMAVSNRVVMFAPSAATGISVKRCTDLHGVVVLRTQRYRSQSLRHSSRT